MTDSEQTEIRERIDALLAQARADEGFAERLMSDPNETLRAAGFDGEALESLTRELSNSEVEGFMINRPRPLADCTYTCDRYSCSITVCGNIPLTS